MTWQQNGVKGHNPAPTLLGNYNGPVVVLGGGRCVWSDVVAIEKILPREECLHMAINDIGQYWHHELTHWVTYHPGFMPGWIRFRREHGYGNGNHVHTHSVATPEHRNRYPAIETWWDFEGFGGGTSGLLACAIALALGFSRLILCGVPMDGSGHFFDPPWVNCTEFATDPEREVWTQTRDRWFHDRVRSMSGNTGKWLGAPTEEWLNGCTDPDCE